jgi:hypothetical protein
MAVAHVSAAATARAPVTTQSAAGDPASTSAPSAAAPPLASTCQASRRSPLGSSCIARRGASRETALESAKNTSSTAPPVQPAPVRMAVPTIHAASAPAPSSARAAAPVAETSAEASIATPMVGGDIGAMSADGTGGRNPDPAPRARGD